MNILEAIDDPNLLGASISRSGRMEALAGVADGCHFLENSPPIQSLTVIPHAAFETLVIDPPPWPTTKIEDQKEFVRWWGEGVQSQGRKPRSAFSLEVDDAENSPAFRNSKFRGGATA